MGSFLQLFFDSQALLGDYTTYGTCGEVELNMELK